MKKILPLIYKLIAGKVFPWLLRRYHLELDQYKAHQDKLLKNILDSYSQTTFGKDHSLTASVSYEDFISRVPIQSYETLEPYLKKERSGARKTILKNKAVIWEKTSGSSGHAKWIPYNMDILGAFRQMLLYWLSDLAMNGPDFKTGKMFFSISPPFQSTDDSKVEAHSFSDDSEYLPWIVRVLFQDYFVFPKGLKEIQNPEDFKTYLCSHLIANKDLEVLFIWNPSYLIQLLEFMQVNQEKILQTIQNGFFQHQGKNYPVPKRDMNQLKDPWSDWKKIWPHLKLISCWTDGSASLFIPKLKASFPDVTIQGKGLLATEGPMTFPILNAIAPLPLPSKIFYEFMDESHQVFRLHELKLNQKYNLIMSHTSGLIRYNIGDMVEVVGFYRSSPTLKFLGRAGNFSDLTGEKLNEIHVQDILKGLLHENEAAFLAPMIDSPPFYYCFYDGSQENFESLLETTLMNTFHYMQSRKLGQLGGIKLVKVPSVEKLYTDFFLKRGLILGDIKFSTLIKNPTWGAELYSQSQLSN